MRCKLFGSIISCVVCAAAASTNSAWFARNWQSDKGLPNNSIYGLAQTSEGYLWLATSVGLVKFDGVRFQKYAFTNSLHAGNRGVIVLLHSRAGGLWAGMDRGGVAYLEEGRAKVFTQKDGLANAQVQSLAEDAEGTLWIVYLGNFVRQIKDGQVINLSTREARERMPAGNFNAMTCDKEGQLWWAAAGQVWVYRDTKFTPMVGIGRGVSSMCPARSGGIWIVDSDWHLFWCDASGQLKDCGEFAPGQTGGAGTVLHEDSSGAVWIGTSSGRLFRYDGSGFESVTVLHPQIQNILEDREGNIWVGTQGGGLYQICRRVIQLVGVESGLPVEVVRSLCRDAKGGLWAVTENGLLTQRTERGWEVVTNSSWAGESVTCVNAGTDGTVWFGSNNRKLHCLREGDPVSFAWPNAGGSVQSLLVSSTGELWIGGVNFLQCLRDGKMTDYKLSDEVHSIRAMAEDANGSIWVGSSRGVLLQVRSNEVVKASVPDLGAASSIRCLAGAKDGGVWIGHAGVGVGRIKDGHYSHVSTEQGLFDDYISQILSDDHGWFWFGSDRGIFKVRQLELEAVMDGRAERVRSILYRQDEGVANLQAVLGRSPEVARSDDGRLWMPTRSGLAVINPKLHAASAVTPNVLLEKVTVDGTIIAQRKNVASGLDEQNRAAIDLQARDCVLRLSPDYRRLEIEFTTLSFVGLENIRFRYRLDGLDEKWNEAGGQRSASYSRLSAKNYAFRVEASDTEGVWNEAGPMLTIVVQPYFWQTAWFVTLAGISLLGTVIMSVRLVEKKRTQRKLAQLEREHAVERERARIAKDIHDDLGANLTEITLLSELAQGSDAPAHEVQADILRIAGKARGLTHSLDEIVWAVNPRNDTLDSFITYTCLYAGNYLRTAGIRCRLKVPEQIPNHLLTANARHNLFLVVKEAMNNIVKHAGASEAGLFVAVEPAGFEVTINDNGRGFTPGNGSGPLVGGNGLVNMSQRLQDIGGQFVLKSAPGEGTTIQLRMNFPPE